MLSNFIPPLLIFLVLAFNNHIQPDEAPPYLYYYSRMLGGIIVERADGTDSRHLGKGVISAGMTGIAGPGWSPSGRYFAVYGIGYADYYTTSQGAYLIDSQGAAVIEQLTFIKGVQQIEWSPTDDLLLVVGSLNSGIQSNFRLGHHLLYWLIDPARKMIVSEFSAFAYGASDVLWELDKNRIRFYIGPQQFAASDQYFEVIMMLGTVHKEPSTQEIFREHVTASDQDSPNYYDVHAVSPSGDYRVDGMYPTILSDTRTGETAELPVHTQGTICRTFIWSGNEQYIITLNGTLIAGGGCNDAVLGVTDHKGELWRELGGCSWDFPPCVGWLPARVKVDILPPGSPRPVQLDPVRIDYEDQQIYFVGAIDHPDFRVRCNRQEDAHITEGDEALYTLAAFRCPLTYTPYREDGLPVIVAYSAEHELLATYSDYGEEGVAIWTKQDDETFEQKLLLNSQGFALEFTNNGKYLRARNVNGRKVYSVADILAVIANSAQP